MLRTGKALAIAIVVSCFAAAWLVWWTTVRIPSDVSPEVATTRHLPLPEQPSNAPAPPVAVAQVQASTPAAQRLPARPSASLDKLRDSKDWSEILKVTATDPSPENFLLSSVARHECEQAWSVWAKERSQDDSLDPRQRKLFEDRSQQCAAMKYSLITDLRKLVRSDPDLAKRLLQAPGSFFYASLLGLVMSEYLDKTNAKLATLKLDAFYNPSDTLMLMLASNELAQAVPGLLVNGQTPNAMDRSSIGVALIMAQCDLGAPCDASHPLMQRACADLSLCDYPTIPELFRSIGDYEKLSMLTCCEAVNFSFQRAQELRAEIVAAVQRGDRRFLTFAP